MPFVKGQSGNPAKQFKPGISGNPSGPKPGYKHLSTHIQELLNDEDFEVWLTDPKVGYKKFEGRPMTAIVQVAMRKAAAGDTKWADLLFKYGYGTKMEIEHSGVLDTGIQDPVKADEFKEFLKGKTKQ